MIDDRRVPNAPDESSAASTRSLPRAPSPNATSPASSPAATTAMRHSARAAAALLITHAFPPCGGGDHRTEGTIQETFLFRRPGQIRDRNHARARAGSSAPRREDAPVPLPLWGHNPPRGRRTERHIQTSWRKIPLASCSPPSATMTPRYADPASVTRVRVFPSHPHRFGASFLPNAAECSPPHLPVSTMPLRPASSAPGRSPPTTSPRRTTPRTTSSRRTSGNSSSASPTCTFS